MTPNTDLDEMEKQLYQWCKEAGSNVCLEFLQIFKNQTLTSTEPGNMWWDAFSPACQAQ